MKMDFEMPTKSLDYLLMGIIAGVIAGIILVYLVGVTYAEMLKVAESFKTAFEP